MANFNKAFIKVVKSEGGYVNDKDDAGGETYLGISRRFHKDSVIWKYIDEIKSKNPASSNSKLTSILKKDARIDDIIKTIYKEKYWDKLRCDEIISQKIAEQLFDMGVNAGLIRAIKLMQRVIGTLDTGYVTDNFIKSINGYSNRQKFNKI